MFSKVRITIIKNKKGEIQDKIDCSDFRFAKTANRNFCYLQSLGTDNICFYDAVPFAAAFN